MSGVNLRPAKTSSPFPPQKQTSSVTNGISASEHAQLSSLLMRMTDRAAKQRLHIKPHFQDYDKHNQGTVSLAQFSRVIALFGFDVSTEIINLMAKQYAVNGDTTKISYKRFLEDLDPSSLSQTVVQEHKTPTFSQPLIRRTDVTIPRTTVLPTSAESVLHKIQTYVSEKRIVLNDLFQDFDHLRRKRIPTSRFRACLNSLGVALNDEELDVLLARFEYPDDVGQVNYPAFIIAVNSAFHLDDAERNPSATISHWSPFTPQDSTTTHFSDAERERLQSLINAIGHAAYTRRILVKPAFQHHDRHRNGCVTRAQFEAVVSTSFPINLSQSDLDLLADLYTRGNIGVNYAAFCQDINQTEKEMYQASVTGETFAQDTPAPLNKTIQPPANNSSPDLESLLSSLLSQLSAQRRLLGNDTFKDFDRLNKGRITSDQFHRTLNVLGLRFTPQQYSLLQQAYAADGDIKTIDYPRFVQDCSTVPSIPSRPHA